jgi:ribonuclease-3
MMGKEDLFARVAGVEGELGYVFNDRQLILQALTHSTFAYEYREETLEDNQRLEFFGDSILGMVVAELLFTRHSSANEGEMTQIRAHFVNKNFLALKAQDLRIPRYLLLGKGEAKMGGDSNFRNLCGALEAVIAAIYLDGGLDAVRGFIRDCIIS